MTFPNLFFCYIYTYNYGQQIYKKIMKKSTLRQIIREEIQRLEELSSEEQWNRYVKSIGKEHREDGDDVLKRWDKLLDRMPNVLKQAFSDIDAVNKDKYSERAVGMDSAGKNYTYVNVKGKPKTQWNKDIKALLGNTNLFSIWVYWKNYYKNK